MKTDVEAPGDVTTEPGKGLPGAVVLVGLAVVGALVAVALGVYGKSHTPTGRPLALLVGFTSLTPMKAWLATAAVVLVIFQVVSALWMYGRLPVKRKAPAVLSQLHRWSGAIAFVATLPVAYHCLWSLGYSDVDTRTALHSLFGCAFYGAFTTKMLALRANKMPSWALPISGGLLFALLIGAWTTSALWYFAQSGVPLR